MKDTQALRPNIFSNLPTFIKEEQAKNMGVSEEEMQLYSLSQSAGWKILDAYIQSLLKDLESTALMSMSQGMTFEEVGKNMVIAASAREVIEKVIYKVQDAKEACEKQDGTVK